VKWSKFAGFAFEGKLTCEKALLAPDETSCCPSGESCKDSPASPEKEAVPSSMGSCLQMLLLNATSVTLVAVDPLTQDAH